MKSAVAVLSLSLTLGMGCGGDDDGNDDSSSTPDGGTTADASSADAEVTPSTGPCTVERKGAAAQVVFHDQDGVPLATMMTNGEGLAVYDDCVANGMVTIINPLFLGGGGGTSNRLVTVQDVMIGDTVVFDPPSPAPSDLGSLTITVQNGDDVASIDPDPSNYIAVAGDCHGLGLPLDDDHGGEIVLDDLNGCLGNDPSNLSIVSIARSDSNTYRGMARVDTDDLDDPATASGGVWAGYGGPALAALEKPLAGAVSGFLVVSPLIDGVLYDRANGGFDPEDETLDMAYWPASIVDGHRISLSLSFADGVTSGVRMRTLDEQPLSFDLEVLLMTPFSSLVVNATDTTRPEYKWEGGDDRAVFARGDLTWVDGDNTGRWTVVASGNTQSLRVPVLPDALADKGPQDSALPSVGRLILADRGIPYAEWLANGISTSFNAESMPEEITREEEDASIATVTFSPMD